jgi:hypothetical protein
VRTQGGLSVVLTRVTAWDRSACHQGIVRHLETDISGSAEPFGYGSRVRVYVRTVTTARVMATGASQAGKV